MRKIDEKLVENFQEKNEQLAELLDMMKKKILNVFEYSWYIPAFSRDVTFKEIVENTRGSVNNLPPDWIEAMRVSLENMPNKFKEINDQLTTVFSQYLLFLEDAKNHVIQCQEDLGREEFATESFKNEVDALRSENAILRERLNSRDFKSELDKLQEVVNSMQSSISNTVPENLQVPPYPPVVGDDAESEVEYITINVLDAKDSSLPTGAVVGTTVNPDKLVGVETEIISDDAESEEILTTNEVKSSTKPEKDELDEVLQQ